VKSKISRKVKKINFLVKINVMDGLQIFSIIIGTAGVIGSFIALATHIINRRIDDMNKRFDDVNKRFDDVNRRIDDTNKRIDSLENSLVRRIEKIEEDNKEIRKELSEMKGDMKQIVARVERIENDVRDIKNLLYKIIDISQNLQQKKE
jgi:septal ring factor EnvC (AmiA/AmiB activator)